MRWSETFHRAERQEATLDPEYVAKVLKFPTPKRYAQLEARASAQALEDDRQATRADLEKRRVETWNAFIEATRALVIAQHGMDAAHREYHEVLRQLELRRG